MQNARLLSSSARPSGTKSAQTPKVQKQDSSEEFDWEIAERKPEKEPNSSSSNDESKPNADADYYSRVMEGGMPLA